MEGEEGGEAAGEGIYGGEGVVGELWRGRVRVEWKGRVEW